ncbi:AAA family ATPase [Nonomuraea sp. bgisy101]|uniref:AAA family ATPase n=1 Tax=Nonomuraea sp. bgisy101 TaxID=3413784 RepID=UPI003D74145D
MSLFGREAELKALSWLVEHPEDGSGVLLRGEAGIGKSALAAAAVAGRGQRAYAC